MSIPDFIDTDILYSPAYWFLTVGTLVAFLIGFAGAESGLLGGENIGIPLFTKIVLLLVTPVISYLISLKFFA